MMLMMDDWALVKSPELLFSLTDAAAHRKCARDSKSLGLNEGKF